MSDISTEILSQRETSFNALSQKRILWDNAEKLFHNQLNDMASQEANSKVFDPEISTLTIERGYRVMAQMGVGKVKGVSSNDIGDAKLKGLLLDKYIVPNATAQFDLLTKFRMADIYSNIYGNFFALIDQDVKALGYIGPDMWLLNIRDVFPQVGAVSLDDSDYVTIRTWKPLSYFEGLKKDQGFTNLGTIIDILKKGSGSKGNRDASNTSKRDQDQFPNGEPAKNKGYFEVLTRFERDRWVDIVVDADGMVFRDQKNPHDDGGLPVECKYSIPLLDDFMGMGDMERGGSMQMVINANWNLYLDAVKMSIFPPMLINKDNVASISSFQSIPGAQWLGRGQLSNIAQAVNLSPQGIATFNNVYQAANASLQKLFGTSTTDVSATTDPTQGKTPEAIKRSAQRENTRDNADRFYQEQFVSRVMKKFVNLISKKQSSTVSFRMFPDEIDKLAREYPEIQDLYDTKTGKVSVKKGKSSALYDWEIVSGSTYAIDQQAQKDFMEMLLQLWLKSNIPQGGNLLVDALKQDGYNFKFGELFKRIVASSGIQDWDKILEEMTGQEKGNSTLDTHSQQFQQMLQGIQSQGMGPQSPQGMPPPPGGLPQGMPPSGQPMPQMPQQPPPKPLKQPSESLNYKDAPPSIQRQIEHQAGLTPAFDAPQPLIPHTPVAPAPPQPQIPGVNG